MNDFETKVHRTWVQFLIDNGHREIAAIAIDAEINIFYGSPHEPRSVIFSFPTFGWTYLNNNEQIKIIINETIKTVVQGKIFWSNGEIFDVDNLDFVYGVKLIEVEKGWQNIAKNLIANFQNPNQAVISEKVFFKQKKEIIVYNEMKFASSTEVRIAQELEKRQILFFPLPLAVRAETGDFYNDHREVDFLICHDGSWGILEVAFHPDRYEKDSEKDSWFKKSGILCIQHYTAERCWYYTNEVVEEFLSILAKYKR